MDLRSYIPEVDQALGGGIRAHTLSEWGVPSARQGRRVIAQFIARNPQLMTLWIYSRPDDRIYPPSWQALGVDLSRIFFTNCSNPLSQLKPVFLENAFKLIILDQPNDIDQRCCGFLAGKAQYNRQNIMLLRNDFLTPLSGNPYARQRMNCWFDEDSRSYQLDVIKGCTPQKVSFSIEQQCPTPENAVAMQSHQ